MRNLDSICRIFAVSTIVLIMCASCSENKTDDVDSGTNNDSSSDHGTPPEGDICNIGVANGYFTLWGVCKKVDTECPGGFAGSLPSDAIKITHGCAKNLDCCIKEDGCSGWSDGFLNKKSQCQSEKCDGGFGFEIGCPAENGICCLVEQGADAVGSLAAI